MQKSSALLLSLSVVIVTLAGWLYGQTGSRSNEPQTGIGSSRFAITSTDEGTVLLDSASGDTWLLRTTNDQDEEAFWVSIRRSPNDKQETLDGGARPGQRWTRLSPFTKVQCLDGDNVQVQFDGKDYELLSIDDLPTAKILQASRKQFGERWEKRFVEDIVEVLTGMGHPPGDNVKLALRDPQTAETHTVARAPLTHDNRRTVYQRHNSIRWRQPTRPGR